MYYYWHIITSNCCHSFVNFAINSLLCLVSHQFNTSYWSLSHKLELYKLYTQAGIVCRFWWSKDVLTGYIRKLLWTLKPQCMPRKKNQNQRRLLVLHVEYIITQTFIKQSLKMKTCMPNHIIKTREKKGQNRLNSFILQFLQTPQIQWHQ